MSGIFDRDLDRSAANSTPLTPLSFLAWAAHVYADKTAVIHGERAFTYSELAARCRRLASALARRGIGPGDTVAVMAPNVPAMLEAHYGVPMVGAVLNALNYRLDARTIAFILEHGEAKLLITDREFSPTIEPALRMLGRRLPVIDIDDPLGEGGDAPRREGLRGVPRRGRSRVRGGAARRRVAGHLPALHLGDHGRSQGRRLSPPRRLSQRARQRADLRALAAHGLSLDAADVPLQRLDLHVGGHRGRRHARVPAPRRSGADLSRHRAATA